MTLTSKVKGHEGPCKPTWINGSKLDRVLTGVQTGFFRLTKKNFLGLTVKTGPEFHGHIINNEVFTTEGL